MNYLFFISLLSAYFPKCLTTPLKILFLVNVFNFPNLTAHFSKCQTILCMSSWFDVVWRQLNYVSSHILCTSVTTSLLYSINKHRFLKKGIYCHILKKAIIAVFLSSCVFHSCWTGWMCCRETPSLLWSRNSLLTASSAPTETWQLRIWPGWEWLYGGTSSISVPVNCRIHF